MPELTGRQIGTVTARVKNLTAQAARPACLLAVAAMLAGTAGCKVRHDQPYPRGVSGDDGPWRDLPGHLATTRPFPAHETASADPARPTTPSAATRAADPTEYEVTPVMPALPATRPGDVGPPQDPLLNRPGATTLPGSGVLEPGPATRPTSGPTWPADPALFPKPTTSPSVTDLLAAPTQPSTTRLSTPQPATLPVGGAGIGAVLPTTAPAPESRPTTAAQTYTGTLQGNVIAIGSETTGWRLAGDGATGGFDVDVTAAEAAARSLDGKRVVISGQMIEKTWPTRGKQPLLVAAKIEAALEENK